MGDLTGSGPIDERLVQRAIASDREMEPRFDEAIRYNRDVLKSDRLYKANDDGQSALEKASKCDILGALDSYASFIQNINLIGEGFEHLEPGEKEANVKARVKGIIDALEKDIIDALGKNCGCSEKK